MRNAFRETGQRGTPDFPFARYRFQLTKPRQTTANTHWHPEQEILYVKTGSIEVIIGKNTFLVEENQICFVPPNALHSVITHSPNTAYFAFVFSYDLLTLPEHHFFQISITEPLMRGRLVFPTVLGGSNVHQRAAAVALEQMCVCPNTATNYKLAIFQALLSLYSALQDTLIPADAAGDTAGNWAVKVCLDYMHDHFGQRITLDQLAQLVHLHPNYLCKLFKMYTGQTVFQQLIHIRLENAAALLEKGSCSVSQTANLCGFESVSFFSRKFKQIIGCPPKEYGKKGHKEFSDSPDFLSYP